MPVRPRTAAPPSQLVDAVRAVLAGEDLPDVAARSGLKAADLQAAVGVYHDGGKAALQALSASTWYSVRITFAGRGQEENLMATVVGPALDTLRAGSKPIGWWFARGYPAWSIYLRNPDPATVRRILRPLARGRALATTQPEIHQPDPRPFGGLTGTAIAHDLFCADSARLLAHLRQAQPRDRLTLSALLLNALLTAAGLSWPARGDVYSKVSTTRPAADATAARRLGAELLATLTAETDDQDPAVPWIRAFATAGGRLAEAAAKGLLTATLTDVLAAVVDAHWDRLGLTVTDQATLARAAIRVYLPS